MIAEIRRIILAQPFAAQWTERQIEEEIKNKFAVVLLNEDASAFISARAVFETAEIENLAVLPEYAQQGAGTKILTNLVQTLREKGVKKVTLEVNETNLPAINFYKKNGFKVLSKRIKFYNGMHDALLMGMDL